MRTCPKVRGIAAHCVRLCPRYSETTAGLTELTINCNNNMYWYVYTTDMCITKKKTENTNQRFQVFMYTYILETTVVLNHSPYLFLIESQSKQQHDFVTGKVKVCNPACLKPSS